MTGLVKKMFWCGRKSFPSEMAEEGHVRVYVGKDADEAVKFDVEANYLNHPMFEKLLQLSGEELGYSYEGALRIACDIDLFLYLLHLLKTSNPSAHYMQLPDLMSKFHNANSSHH